MCKQGVLVLFIIIFSGFCCPRANDSDTWGFSCLVFPVSQNINLSRALWLSQVWCCADGRREVRGGQERIEPGCSCLLIGCESYITALSFSKAHSLLCHLISLHPLSALNSQLFPMSKRCFSDASTCQQIQNRQGRWWDAIAKATPHTSHRRIMDDDSDQN